jgi:hypothetical protein
MSVNYIQSILEFTLLIKYINILKPSGNFTYHQD